VGDAGQPGHADLVRAEFKAKMQARASNPDYDAEEAFEEEKTFKAVALLIRWAILVAAGALLTLFMEDRVVTVGVIVFIALAVMTEVWLWRRRSGVPTED
jgi:hypothetical protein